MPFVVSVALGKSARSLLAWFRNSRGEGQPPRPRSITAVTRRSVFDHTDELGGCRATLSVNWLCVCPLAEVERPRSQWISAHDLSSRRCPLSLVRLEGAKYLWRRVPPSELSQRDFIRLIFRTRQLQRPWCKLTRVPRRLPMTERDEAPTNSVPPLPPPFLLRPIIAAASPRITSLSVRATLVKEAEAPVTP